jgi:hypothetical protein
LLHNAEEKLAVLADKAQESYVGLGELPPAKP